MSPQTLAPKRVQYMDIAKGLAIIGVVVGHAEAPISNLIYLFHIPLFFFISGYFYKDIYTLNPILYIKKRLKVLYIPFIFFQLIFLLFHNLLYDMNFYTDYFAPGDNFYQLKDFVINIMKIITFNETEQLSGAFWFFAVLFEVNVLFVIISYLLKKTIHNNFEITRFIFICLIFLIGCFTNVIYLKLPNKFDIVFVTIIFFYSGYLYMKFEEYIKYKFSYVFVFSIILILSSFLGRVNLSHNEFPNHIFLLLNAFLGIYCVFYISKYLTRKKLNIIKYIGRHTIPIVGLHYLFFKIVILIQILLWNYNINYLSTFPVLYASKGWWILYSLMGIFLPIILLKVLNRSRLYKTLSKY